ncbi:oxidative stress transcriptional regulator AosR [Mycolicibacterium insubricum]|uniref:Uncharacterized protein n=1 Tax=Mycolicibacterium insubricum TaxID=444597 RepID=A0A1X0D0R9_9MYCO|nr:DUF2017 domain-containing protein [Mycolicibacterium insubricum]MCV7081812.1 DUF2017 domain-containing protein [Mycolicibacterium insubricum]ORA65925.1 hypothetical protein BST26_17905 [Mycolicibacterium insubricum]
MRRWKRVQTADGVRFRSVLEPHEGALLHDLATSVLAMLDDREAAAPPDELAELTGIRTGNPAPPADATMSRLLPDFYRPTAAGPGDPDPESVNTALRILHEPEIITAKREAAQRMLGTCPRDGGRLELTTDDAEAWIAAVNDIRLALGAILEIGPDGPARLSSNHPMAGHLDVYQWLTTLQELLVLCLMGKPA